MFILIKTYFINNVIIGKNIIVKLKVVPSRIADGSAQMTLIYLDNQTNQYINNNLDSNSKISTNSSTREDIIN